MQILGVILSNTLNLSICSSYLKKTSLLENQKIAEVENLKAGALLKVANLYQFLTKSNVKCKKMNDLLHSCLFLVSTFQNSKISQLTR